MFLGFIPNETPKFLAIGRFGVSAEVIRIQPRINLRHCAIVPKGIFNELNGIIRPMTNFKKVQNEL